MLREVALAVVQEDRVRPARREQDQIEVAVAVDVGERGTGRVAVARADAGRLRDVLELPAAEIPVERAAALRAAEKDVDEPVAVDVAERDAGALPENAIAEQQRSRWRRSRIGCRCCPPSIGVKPGCTARHRQLAPAIPLFLVPGRGCRRSRTPGDDDAGCREQDQREMEERALGTTAQRRAGGREAEVQRARVSNLSSATLHRVRAD